MVLPQGGGPFPSREDGPPLADDVLVPQCNGSRLDDDSADPPWFADFNVDIEYSQSLGPGLAATLNDEIVPIGRRLHLSSICRA